MGKVTGAKGSKRQQVEFSAGTASAIAQALAQWFLNEQRNLNFRQTRDPYAIMVSEFMLQQTTVAAVEPYYERFLQRFPSVHELAASSEDEVMQYWAGLGYYRRARQLRSAAIEVVNKWNGNFPRTVQELQSLPGFGRYTAGAVLSLAFDEPAAILEANTIRVFARLAGRHGVVGDTEYMKSLWSLSESLVKAAESPRMANLSAMELGALICKPRPRCGECPVNQWCIAYREGIAEVIPQPRPRREKKQVTVACAAIRDQKGQYLVRRIPEGEWHGGLWEFPAVRTESQSPGISEVQKLLTPQLSPYVQNIEPFTCLKYTVTHHDVTCHVFHCHGNIDARDFAVDGEELRLFPLGKISELAMGSAQKKLLKLLLVKAAEGKFNDI